MTRRLHNQVYLCGGNYRPGPRGACPNVVHDWPLPAGYVDAATVAEGRLRRRWTNAQCDQCGLYGWIPGRINPETDHHIPAREDDDG
jgi:hypothetical protein